MSEKQIRGMASRVASFGTSIFAEMTRLATEHKATNLSQGFPDFDGPAFLREGAKAAIDAGQNQYARMLGHPLLCEAIGARWRAETGLSIDTDRQVQVTSGCTEALAATFLGLVEPGDEVVMFEPFYDSYRACASMAGARVRPVRLIPGVRGWEFDERELEGAFGERTRAILVNTPHNPTGKVFTREELLVIARLCERWGVVAITDEVYERLVYREERPHVRMATLPGMEDRTLTLSSIGKSFSVTGWKIGWAIGPAELVAGVRAAHQFLTFAVSTPMQIACAEAIRPGGPGDAYVASLVEEYRAGLGLLGGALTEMGFGVMPVEGSYFIMADHRMLGFENDVDLCRDLVVRGGVAAIPPSAFYERPEDGAAFVRFAFCKRRETLEAAIERLRAWREGLIGRSA
ncbi:MAG: aminotransferase class I/II-fold pyridoxal phosphate-dependent enzyme [Phycisphaeraceae bacterium]|nr:MAG: aminotransferase class I/II-fold pyridoxal phosphate-dependent enzyme [Phycisphaeraceae bacterium]